MDFDLTDEQEATAEAATKLLADKSTPESLRAVEQRDELRFDRDLWSAMADAGLLGIAVPEEHGGAGLGLLELCLVLAGGGPAHRAPCLRSRRWPSPACRSPATARPSCRRRSCPAMAAGTTVATAALVEPLGDPTSPDHHRQARRRRLGARGHQDERDRRRSWPT